MKIITALIIFLLLYLAHFVYPIRAEMREMTLKELTEGAQAIVLGKVEKKESKKDEKGNIFTYVTFNAEKYIKGDTGKDRVTIRYLGGCINDVCQSSGDDPSFEVNEKALVFLKKLTADDNIYTVPAMFQGVIAADKDIHFSEKLLQVIALQPGTVPQQDYGWMGDN